MSYRKILLMQSVEDSITRNRKKKIESNPAVQGCEFAHCYAVELTPVQKMMVIPLMMELVLQQPFDTKDLAERLTRQIAEFQPDLFLVHPGFVFQAFTNEVVAALKIVKARFPNLKFGLLNSESPFAHIHDDEHFFDDDTELRGLIEQISIPLPPIPHEIFIPKECLQWRDWKVWDIGQSLN